LRVDEDVGKAACFFFGAVEAEQASGHDARFRVAARDGIGQSTGSACIASAAVGGIAHLHALVAAKLPVRATAFVDVRRIDDKRTTQRAQPAGRED